ncbi:methionine synthase [Thermodesulfobacteriota bacterium]
MKKRPAFNFMATGIGSVPWSDVDTTCEKINNFLPSIPFWPQLVKRSPFEDMNVQFTEGLPLLKIDSEEKSITASTVDMEEGLFEFYNHYLSDDTEYFAISREYAPGLYKQVDLIARTSDLSCAFIKGHLTGPVTFAASVKDNEGKSILGSPDLLEAYTKGLAIKALWQVRELEKSGKRAIIFLDEPYLSGFGSAFLPIERHQVIKLLKEVIDYLRDKTNCLTGIHCCGNTDWSMIVDSNPDIINFDAFSFMDYFLLFRDEIKGFVEKGGVIAWGIVPTGDSAGSGDIDELYKRLNNGIDRLCGMGLERERVSEGSILTPACGMGTMNEEESDTVLKLLSGLSERMSSDG